MRRISAILAPVLFVGAASAISVSGGPSAEPQSSTPVLVSPEWLQARLDDPNLVLLHVGDLDAYPAEHLPGARFIRLADISAERVEGGLSLQMSRPDRLRSQLERLGISDDSQIVVYYGDDWVSPTTRVVFTLLYAGLGERTSVLAGGMGRWKREGRPVTDVVPQDRQGHLSPLRVRNELVVDADFVSAHNGAPGFALVDARAAVFYDGVEAGTGDVLGHIPGAGSVPFSDVVDESLEFKPAAELRALFEQAGVVPGDTVIGYCHIGQQATAMLFAARIAGHEVRLYDGSFQDWARQHRPVENTSAGGR